MADYSSTLEAIRQQAQERLAQGISEEDLRAYGRNIGLTESEIDYVLSESQPKYQPQVFSGTSMSDLNKAIAADAYITKLATDLGDTNVSAGEQLALSDPEVRQLAENAFQRKNVDKISDTDLSSYAKALGLNQDLTDYLLGKEMNLGTDYDIGSNVDSAAATEQAKQAAIKATGKDPTKMTTADYLAAVLATPTGTGTGTSTVKGGTGTDTVTGGTGTKGSGFDTSEGYGGVKVQGESGLREGYTDYVQDYLERMSGLLARRNVDPKTGKPVYRGPQFGDTGVGGYGTDTL
ncbi:hypothetical protein EB118_26275, partial [bacterium]|nr:hypothetical protein [bacterium]